MDPRNLPRSPSPEELVEEVLGLLRADLPEDWARLRLDFRDAGISQAVLSGARQNGQPLLDPLPAGVSALLREVRAAMYEPGRGTWFSAHVELRRDAEPEVRFNFTDDPQWSPTIAPTAFVLDHERFPRDDEHVPDWLAARFAEAAEFEAEWEG